MPEKRIAQGVEKRAQRVRVRREVVQAVVLERAVQAKRARIVSALRDGCTVRGVVGGHGVVVDSYGDAVSVIPDWTEADEVFYQARLADSNNQSK